ncbi:cyclic nucleotide-gated channel cone photoreceptor subunit alpha-like [Physella acuta]|uniref:cyclic nucleotide-gated channel cone photoreceptor subunit alpha-like n=1 Tax=Physella acuta TaxID=109671 RepID=UPI0027DE8794|nr:cyclic nucleotide-gated channel cone photoreceptor subunit alpha-like [Physella acuta]
MSGVLTRRKPGEGGVSVRYTPCAKSELQADGADSDQEQIAIVEEEPREGEEEEEFAGSSSSGGGGSGGGGGVFHLPKRTEFTCARVSEGGGGSRGDAEVRTHNNEHYNDIEIDDDDGGGVPDGPGRGSLTGTLSQLKRSQVSVQTVVAANGPRNSPPGTIFTAQSTSTDRVKLIGERLSSSDKISLSSPIYSSKVLEQKAKSTSKQSLLDLFSSRLDKVKVNRKRFSLAQASLMKKPRPSDGNIIAHTTRNQRRQRRKEISRNFGRKSIKGDARIETAASVSSDRDGCNWTFVFDPSGRLCYWWSSVVSVAFLYNFWVLIYRFAFQEINSNNLAVWFTLDYSADLLYLLDIAFHFRSGYLEDGVLQTDPTKLRIHYMNTTMFYIDCLCLLPIDFLYLSIGFCSILRCFRLVKVYRFWSFLDRTERHTNYPNVIRTATLIHYLLALFHWNACLYYVVCFRMNKPTNRYNFPKDEKNTLIQYLHALYLSVISLTTIGAPPPPKSVTEYLFVIFELLFALLLFATVLGHIANIVTNVSAARKEFQGKCLL